MMDPCEQLRIAIDLEAFMVVAGIGPEITITEVSIAKSYIREKFGIEPDKKFIRHIRRIINDGRRKHYKGLRRTHKRNAKEGRGGNDGPANANAIAGAMRHEGKKGVSKDMENRPARECGVPEKYLAPAGSDISGLRPVLIAGDTGRSCEHLAV